MEPLEQKLKRALTPEEPPPGFADRVMARVAAASEQQPHRVPAPAPRDWWRPAWLFGAGRRAAMAGALACLLFIAAGLGLAWRQQRVERQRQQERMIAEKARAELILALEITNAKLNRVRQILEHEPRGPRMVRE